jgi:hypothetical protein
MVFMLRRRDRVTCAQCAASHPGIYRGQQCLICGSIIDSASGQRQDAPIVETPRAERQKYKALEKNYKAAEKNYKAQIAALQSQRDELRAALTALKSKDVVGASEYDWQVELAAKGMAERDNHPMPKSVTTPEAFYRVMAGAALDAIDLRALLNRMTRAERYLETRFSRDPMQTESTLGIGDDRRRDTRTGG